MPEKRKTTFRKIKKICNYYGIRMGVDGRPVNVCNYNPYEPKKCSASNCTVWKGLKK